MSTATDQKEKTIIEIAPNEMLAALTLAIKNIKTGIPKGKEIFENCMVQVLKKQNLGIITASNSSSYTKVAFPIRQIESENNNTTFCINAEKLKAILKALPNKANAKITITDNNIMIKAGKTQMKIAKLNTILYEEAIKPIEFKKDTAKEIAKIKIGNLRRIVKEALSILKIDTEKTQGITFETKENSIALRTVTTTKSTGIKSVIPAVTIEKDKEFTITKESCEILQTFLSVAVDEKKCSILIDQSESTAQIKTNYGIFVTPLLNIHIPKAIDSIIQEIFKSKHSYIWLDKNELSQTMKRVEAISKDLLDTIVTITIKNNSITIHASNKTGEINEILTPAEIENENPVEIGDTIEFNGYEKLLRNIITATQETEAENLIKMIITKVNNIGILASSSISRPERVIMLAGIEK